MCLAAIVYLTENAGRKSWVKIIAALGGILGVLYASNQEQSACVLGGMLCGYIFWYFMTHDKKVNIPAVLFLAVKRCGSILILSALKKIFLCVNVKQKTFNTKRRFYGRKQKK